MAIMFCRCRTSQETLKGHRLRLILPRTMSLSLEHTLVCHSKSINALSISPGGTTLLSGGELDSNLGARLNE
jgi:WD40 repeat protein